MHKESELGSDGDFVGSFGARVIGWRRGAPARHQPIKDLSMAPKGKACPTAFIRIYVADSRVKASQILFLPVCFAR